MGFLILIFDLSHRALIHTESRAVFCLCRIRNVELQYRLEGQYHYHERLGPWWCSICRTCFLLSSVCTGVQYYLQAYSHNINIIMVTQYLMFDTNFQYCIKLILTCCTSAEQKQECICFGCKEFREGFCFLFFVNQIPQNTQIYGIYSKKIITNALGEHDPGSAQKGRSEMYCLGCLGKWKIFLWPNLQVHIFQLALNKFVNLDCDALVI